MQNVGIMTNGIYFKNSYLPARERLSDLWVQTQNSKTKCYHTNIPKHKKTTWDNKERPKIVNNSLSNSVYHK